MPRRPPSLLALPTLHVADIELPRELEPLYGLAYNLWWAWTPEARALFASIDPAAWARYRNPVQVLINVEPKQWYHLLDDEDFLARYRAVLTSFDAYMGAAETWFSQSPHPRSETIAYFSMEYGLHQSLAIYSGGLGVLSGDHCKSASDLGLPFVGVGLLYRRGYFQQTVDADGMQQHVYPEYDFSRLPLRPLVNGTGRPLQVAVPLPGRDVKVQLWLAQVGRVPLVLLDTDIPENDASDRPIANQLYVSGREMRLVQEVVLGRGGVLALEALGIEPSVWHINEGHSAFLQLERLRALVANGRGIAEGLNHIASTTVFTTHTPVPAGNEQFDRALVVKYLDGWCAEVGLDRDRLFALGAARDDDPLFNLTALAIRTSRYANGVSKLNAKIASRMWRHLFDADAGKQPVRPITNGVHTGTWLGVDMRALYGRHWGHDWAEQARMPSLWKRAQTLPDHETWSAHQAQKARLGRFARSLLREQRARHGSSPDELRAVGGLFDPEALTIGFARRFATYKRASLVFSDLERLRAMLADDDRPVQMIFAGKAHPADRPGQELIQEIFRLSRSETLTGKIFFLENYDIRMGQMLVQGVDVWLNTPRRPHEASGTSGMKVALNGGLNLSILDGWWPEAWNGKNGWAIGNDHHGYDDEAEQDRADAESLYTLLADAVIKPYYDRDASGVSASWVAMMKEAIATLSLAFSSDRMVRDYVEDAYFPRG